MKGVWVVKRWMALLLTGAAALTAQAFMSETRAVAQSYEYRTETTRVEVMPGRYETQWVPAEYGTALDSCGRPYSYVARPGYTRQVWVEPVYEYRTQTVRVVSACPTPVVYTAAPVVYAPAPVVCAPAPVVCAPAPVVYVPAPCPPPVRRVEYCPPARTSVSVSVNFGSTWGGGADCRPRTYYRPEPVRPYCPPPGRSGWRSEPRGGSGFSADVGLRLRYRD